MRALLAAVVLAAALAPAAALASSSPPGASIRLQSRTPLVVVGVRFRPHEHVTLIAFALVPVRRRVVASRTGSFRLVLPRAPQGRCGTAQIRAVGSLGSVAAIKLPLPACMAY